MYPDCPEEISGSYVKVASFLTSQGICNPPQKPIWRGKVDCGYCVDENGINAVSIVCLGIEGCRVMKVPVKTTLELLFETIEPSIFAVVKEATRYGAVPKEIARIVEGLPVEPPPEEYVESLKRIIKKKLEKARKVRKKFTLFSR